MRSTVNGMSKLETDGLLIHLDAANEKSYSGTGTAWNNLKNSTADVTLYSGPSFNTDVKSITFDGINDYGGFNSSDWSMLKVPTLTICSWVNPILVNGNPNDGSVIFSDNDTGRLLLGMRYGGSNLGVFFYVVGNVGSPLFVMTGVSGISAGNWYYYTFVVDLPGQNIKGYINGNQVYSNTNNYGTDFAANSVVYGPTLASRYGGSFSQTHTKMATFSFYNRVLSQTEILQNYNALKSRFGL